MIIEWTYGAFQQLKRYYDIGHIWTQAGGVAALASGIVSIAISVTKPEIAFTGLKPEVDFSSVKPLITLTGE